MSKTAANTHAAAAWPDRLRNLATLMVVAIHVAAPIAHQYPDYHTAWWWAGNFWNSLSRPGVPLFVMLSGYLLLGKDYPLPQFLQKRFLRVVVPALFWMLIYAIYNHIAKGRPADVREAAVDIVNANVHYHLWFIYLILGLYLVCPILRPWVRNAREQDYWYFFAMCIVGTWLYKILYTFFGLAIGIYFELFTNNCGYFVLGYYLGIKTNQSVSPSHELKISPWRFSIKQLCRIAGALILLGTLTTMFASYLLNTTFWNGQPRTFFYDYLTPNVGISAIGWFLLARWAFDRWPLLDIERDFAAASFGIYFAHVLIMDWWGQCGYWHSKVHPLYGLPILICLIGCMAFLVISVIRTLPGGQKIT
jgi:surface polysaccharide O-acyltransferase-like enzyme